MWQNVEKFKGGEYFCKPLYSTNSQHSEFIYLNISNIFAMSKPSAAVLSKKNTF